jgi:hypothetical protein
MPPACPPSVAQGSDAGVCGATISYATPTVLDNCNVSSLVRTAGQASGTLFSATVTTTTYRVTDTSGNQATCSFTVNITDTQAPTIGAKYLFFVIMFDKKVLLRDAHVKFHSPLTCTVLIHVQLALLLATCPRRQMPATGLSPIHHPPSRTTAVQRLL